MISDVMDEFDEKIAECCNKYLGEFSIPQTEHLLDYYDIALSLMLIVQRPFSGDFYNINDLQKSIQKIENCLRTLDDELLYLPQELYVFVEEAAFSKMKTSHFILRDFIDETEIEYEQGFLKEIEKRMRQSNPISTFVQYLSFLTQVKKYNKEKQRWQDNPSIFTKAFEAKKPIRDINHGRSKNRIIKVRIIDLLREVWTLQKGNSPPKLLPYEGHAFGDFVHDIFKIMKINADERSAINAWYEEIGKSGLANT